MSFSEFTPKDHEAIAAAYAPLRESAARRCANDEELAVVQKAFDFANEAHKNVRRRSGEPYILHPIEVARIVVEDIGLGYKSISAALLHDVVEDTDYTVEDIRNLFGEKIASLVDGLTKIKTVLDNEEKGGGKNIQPESLQAENFKKILLTMNDDVRVVLIKLADRLHNCRTIEFMPEYKRDKILSETMYIFIPLAHRLGLYGIKSEMENLWLRYKEPAAWEELSRMIEQNRADKQKEIEAFIAPIEDALNKAGFQFEVRKRVKTPYSVWHKMQTKHIPFELVYDLYAIRIIFQSDGMSKDVERDECYHIFSIITGIYRYKPDRVRDWVKHPKGNGYEALHCTLMAPSGIWIEVQIRTKRMDDIAEKGIAAHWAYKRDGYVSENDSEMDRWLEKVKEILINPDVNALELLDIIHNDLNSQDILVFTPQGEQKTIAKGATALDFAYLIHTEIGNKAIAAKVNMRLVPLSHVLRQGDQVEIITAGNERPKREWLQFLQTRKARNIVIDYFKGSRADTVELGRKTLTEQLAAIGTKADESTLRKLLAHFGLNSADEFYFRIGLGLVRLGSLSEVLEKSDRPKWTSWFRRSTKESGSADKCHIAPCCHPIPGDPVVGIREADGSVTVHKKACPVAEDLAAKHGDRVVVPDWSALTGVQGYPVRISIRGLDRVGLLNEITRYISLVMGVNMRKLVLGADEGIFEGYIDLAVHDRDALDRMIRKLEGIEGIQSVVRTDISQHSH